MLELIVSKHDITSSFWDLASCFYTRNIDVESAFCIPYTESRNGSIVGPLFPIVDFDLNTLLITIN
jgi:hypothetical protein